MSNENPLKGQELLKNNFHFHFEALKMSTTVFKMRCITPNYLKKRYFEVCEAYCNEPLSNRPPGYHYVYIYNDCHLFDTRNEKHDYQSYDLKACGMRTNINIAVFVYFMHKGMRKDCLPVFSETQISHLCGHRACINPMHLNLESTKINISRIACHRDSRSTCAGHGKEPACI